MTVIDFPDPPTQQRLDALSVANKARAFKKQRKEALKKMDDPYSVVVAMFRGPEGHEGSFTCDELLRTLPSVRELRSRQMLTRAMVPSHRRLRDLTAAQRQRLAFEVEQMRSKRVIRKAVA